MKQHILRVISDFSDAIFTVAITDSMDVSLTSFVDDSQRDRALSQSDQEAVECIQRLCSDLRPAALQDAFARVPDIVRLNILSRMRYFENTISDASEHELAVLPMQQADLLRYGLIELWNERLALAPWYRSN